MIDGRFGFVKEKMKIVKNRQSTIENRKSPHGTLLDLKVHQITGFFNGSICPLCKEPRIIHRQWRKDYYCGGCREVFDLVDGNVRHLGNQEDLD